MSSDFPSFLEKIHLDFLCIIDCLFNIKKLCNDADSMVKTFSSFDIETTPCIFHYGKCERESKGNTNDILRPPFLDRDLLQIREIYPGKSIHIRGQLQQLITQSCTARS